MVPYEKWIYPIVNTFHYFGVINAFSGMMKQLGTWVSNSWSCCQIFTLKWRCKIRLLNIFLFTVSPEIKCNHSWVHMSQNETAGASSLFMFCLQSRK